jgi:hypothetical protein
MKTAPWCCVLVLGASAVSGQEGDPLASPACRNALSALSVREAAALAAPTASAASEHRSAVRAIQAARERAARACLGAADGAIAPQRAIQAPISVPPVGTVTATVPRRTATTPDVTLPPRAEPPRLVTTCDAVGCWASDGSYLLRSGPNLVSPRGLCSVQGSVVVCP